MLEPCPRFSLIIIIMLNDRSKTRKPKPSPPSSPNSQTLTLICSMARKSSLLKQTLVTISVFLALYAFFYTFLNSSTTSKLDPSLPSQFSRDNCPNFPRKSSGSVKVYMYDLPRKFTYGIIEQHTIARGGAAVGDVSSLKYPGHQHMGEWYLFSDLIRPEKDRVGSPVTKVSDPEEADLFYVPYFSSLSLIANPGRPANPSAVGSGSGSVYSDEEMQEALIEWLEEQEYWRRNTGRDHVIIAQDPNALFRVIDRVKNAVLLVSDFGRLRVDQASLVKDVIVPYSHRINPYVGKVGVEKRNTLLFFMGNRYRKEGGKVRDLLFQILENEEDIVIKHGTQSRESRRAATHGMHSSKFCLHPAGDTPSACRLFDAIVSLCVPVIVSDSIELPFEDIIDYTKIAIFVDSKSAVKQGVIASILRSVTTERIVEYQKELKEVKRYFQYDVANGTVNEIWRQVTQKVPLIKLMINREKRVVTRDLTEPDCACLCSNQTGRDAIL